MKLIVYTCVTDKYDWVTPPLFQSKDISYICFTDDEFLRVQGWDMHNISPDLKAWRPNLINRYYKLFPWKFLPAHEWSVYIDANIRIRRNPLMIIKSSSSVADMIIPSHPRRSKLKEELNACIRLGKIQSKDHDRIYAKIKEFGRQGYFDNLPLSENNIIFRRNDEQCLIAAMTEWWDMLTTFSDRDQLSLPFLLWKHKIRVAYIHQNARQNDFFAICQHRNRHTPILSYIQAMRYNGMAWKLIYLAMKKLGLYDLQILKGKDS